MKIWLCKKAAAEPNLEELSMGGGQKTMDDLNTFNDLNKVKRDYIAIIVGFIVSFLAGIFLFMMGIGRL